MKINKVINEGELLTGQQLADLTGGKMMANINNSDNCTCSGGSGGNANSAPGCTCYGGGNNLNSSGCLSCGSLQDPPPGPVHG